jgi:hypothetical protein
VSQVEAQQRQRAAAEARQRAAEARQVRQRAAVEAQRQHAERTRAVVAETGFAVGVLVQVDGAGFGTVVGVTTGSQIRVRVGRSITDFPRDQLRVVASDDAAPASPATPQQLEELAAPAPAPTPEDALDAAAAPAPVAQPCADQVDELAALVQSMQVRGGVPPGYESMLAEALGLLRVMDAAARAGGAAPLQQFAALPAALPSRAADLVAPPAARPHTVETPLAPAPMAMEPVRTASPEPSEDAAAAASPVAATAVAPTRLAVAASQPSTTATPAPASNPMIIRISKPESLRRKPRRSARRTPRSAAPTATAPPARKRRRARATASPEPAASDASAPAERPAKKQKRDWTPAEDDRLLAAREDGLTAWKAIAERVGGSRDGKQCRERYANHLDPTIKKGNWSPKEDTHLLALSESDLPKNSRGTDWERVAASLPTVDGRRKGPDVKNRYNGLKRRKR